MKPPSAYRHFLHGIMMKSMYVMLAVMSVTMAWQTPAFCAQDALIAMAPETRSKAARWIAGEQLSAERDLAEQQQRVADAQGAVSQALSALNLASEYKDAEAVPIAQHALATANEALALARRHLAEQQQRAANLKIMLERIPADARTDVVALPLTVRGDVRVQSGSKTVPLEPTHVLQPGDEVIVGDRGFALLSLSEGHQLQLRENSVFTFEKHTRQTLKGLIEQYIYDLKQGVQRTHRRGPAVPDAVRGSINDEHLYRAVGSVAAVRGTDFQMAVGADGLGRLTLFDGRIELAADAEAKPHDKLQPWWLTEGVPAYAVLPENAVARIVMLRGAAVIIGQDKQSRPAHAGDTITAGERIETAADTIAHLDLTRGQRIALGGGARFTSVLDRTSGAPIYALGLGHARVWGANDKQPSQFLTPNTVAESHAREFEVNVMANGVAEYTPIEGSLDLSAVGKKLDWSKVDEWWDR